MSEPTLEQIKDEGTLWAVREADAVLAREIIALRETIERSAEVTRNRLNAHMRALEVDTKRLDSHNRVMESIVRRVRVLEQQARPFQEDGHLAVEACACIPRWRISPLERQSRSRAHMAACPMFAREDGPASWDALTEMEQRAEAAERERDEALEKLTQNVRMHYPLAFTIICAERDAARASVERLRKFIWTLNHVKGCGWYLDASNCTCGLTAALEDA